MSVPADPDDLSVQADLDAGYDLLGRQATVAEWSGVLERLTALCSAGQEIDLELVARRTVRRPVAVVTALLGVCRSVHSAQSLFVVRAVEALRDEQIIQDRARTTAEAVLSRLSELSQEASLAPADPLEALYYLLSQSYPDQRERWMQASDDWRASVVTAIRAERDRLRDLTKDASASSGSYLHFLRHRLADLILVCGIDGDVGEWAYRILQLRTEDLEDLRPLLRVMFEDGRQRYVSWALTPRKGAPTDRIRFLLSFAGDEFPDDLDIDMLLVLATNPDSAVAADSLIIAIELRPSEPRITTLASKGIAELPYDDARRIASALIRSAPDLIKITAIPIDRADLVAGAADDRQENLARAIANQLATLPGDEAVLRWVKTLQHLTTDDGIFAAAATQAVGKATVDPRPESAARSLEHLLEVERFREAFWTVLEDVPATVLSYLTAPLLRRDDPQSNAQRLGAALHQLTDEHYTVIRAAAINGVCDGTVDAGDLANAWPGPDRDPTAVELRRRIDQADEQLGRLEADVVDVEAALRRELANEALPILHDAAASSAANAGIQGIYHRLAEALEPPRRDPAPERSDESPSGVTAELGPHRSDSERLQALLKLDTDKRELVASSEAKHQLGQDGFAERVLCDLFERGPMFQIAVRLSADTRSTILDAAIATGFQPSASWTDHPALGGWLRQELARRTSEEDERPGGADLSAIFRVAATTFARLHALEHDLASKRGEVSREMAAQLAPLLDELNTTVDAYYQVWRALQPALWRPVELIGTQLRSAQLDPDRHEILAGQGSPLFVVRRPGVEVDGHVVERARLEGVDA